MEGSVGQCVVLLFFTGLLGEHKMTLRLRDLSITFETLKAVMDEYQTLIGSLVESLTRSEVLGEPTCAWFFHEMILTVLKVGATSVAVRLTE